MQYRCLRNYAKASLKRGLSATLYSYMHMLHEQDRQWLDKNLGEYGQRWSMEYRSAALVTYLFATKEDLVLFKLARGDHG